MFANRFAKGVWETDGNRQSQWEIDMLMGGYSSEQRPQRLYPGEQWESLTPEGRTQKPGESQVLDTQCKGTVGKQEENSMPPPRFSNQLDGWLTSCGQTHSLGNSIELSFDYAVHSCLFPQISVLQYKFIY